MQLKAYQLKSAITATEMTFGTHPMVVGGYIMTTHLPEGKNEIVALKQ